jgi:hypothetical protein
MSIESKNVALSDYRIAIYSISTVWVVDVSRFFSHFRIRRTERETQTGRLTGLGGAASRRPDARRSVRFRFSLVNNCTVSTAYSRSPVRFEIR